MVTIAELWLPIVVSAVLVFLASTVIHMMLRYHKNDWSGMPDEDAVRDAMQRAGIGPGDYHFPKPSSAADMKSAEYAEKVGRAPSGFMTILPPSDGMGKQLVHWFIYSLVVGVMVAYVTGRTTVPATEYLAVFRVSGAVAFLAYAGADPIMSIWMGRRWGSTLRNMLDGLIYALVTAGAFGWLWPS